MSLCLRSRRILGFLDYEEALSVKLRKLLLGVLFSSLLSLFARFCICFFDFENCLVRFATADRFLVVGLDKFRGLVRKV